MKDDEISLGGIVVKISIGFLLLISLMLWGCPQYKVYSARKEGEAILAHAQSSREAVVAEAKAKFESADWLAKADTVRAHGVARTNQIIGNSLKDNQEYLQWLWIDQIEKANTIYIPTEGNLPILEASRAARK